MAFVTAIIMLALIEYLYFGSVVGRMRVLAGIRAPAVTGDPEFERVFRAHQNTLEQLIVFVPAVAASGYFVNELFAVAVGVVYLFGRAMYFRAYRKDAATRAPGMLVSFSANVVLVLGALAGALLAAFG